METIDVFEYGVPEKRENPVIVENPVNHEVPTPEEFKNEMKEILEQYHHDAELFHVIADNYICDVMRALGFEEGVQIFEDADKWYA